MMHLWSSFCLHSWCFHQLETPRLLQNLPITKLSQQKIWQDWPWPLEPNNLYCKYPVTQKPAHVHGNDSISEQLHDVISTRYKQEMADEFDQKEDENNIVLHDEIVVRTASNFWNWVQFSTWITQDTDGVQFWSLDTWKAAESDEKKGTIFRKENSQNSWLPETVTGKLQSLQYQFKNQKKLFSCL